MLLDVEPVQPRVWEPRLASPDLLKQYRASNPAFLPPTQYSIPQFVQTMIAMIAIMLIVYSDDEEMLVVQMFVEGQGGQSLKNKYQNF